jgi:hypothetical protein
MSRYSNLITSMVPLRYYRFRRGLPKMDESISDTDLTSITGCVEGAYPGPIQGDSSASTFFFDGANDSGVLGTASDIDDLSGVTLCWWQKTNSLGGGSYARIFDKVYTTVIQLNGTSNNDNGGTASEIRFGVTTSGTNIAAMSHIGFPHGIWNFCTVTWAGTIGSSPSGVKIYRNAVEDTAINVTGTPSGSRTSDASSTAFLGNRAAADRCVDGYLAEFTIFDSVLSASQIRTLYDAAVGKRGVAV